MRQGHRRRAIGVRGDQRGRGQGVDLTRDAVREAEDLAARVGREHDRAVATGHVDVVVDVAQRLVGRERVQAVVHGDALTQLAQLVTTQVRLELGLTHEEHLQQLLALVLQVREQADLLEQLHGQVLRLVHHEHGVLAARTHGDEVLLERHQRGGLAHAARQLQPEAQADLLDQLLTRERRVRDERDRDAIAPLVERVVERRRLARAHLAGDQQEGLAVLDAVAQVGSRLLMLTARIDELELMTRGERVLAQTEMMFEHRWFPWVGLPCAYRPTRYRPPRAGPLPPCPAGPGPPGGGEETLTSGPASGR